MKRLTKNRLKKIKRHLYNKYYKKLNKEKFLTKIFVRHAIYLLYGREALSFKNRYQKNPEGLLCQKK